LKELFLKYVLIFYIISAGYITDKWPHCHHLFLFLDTLILGLSTAAFPFMGHLYGFLALGVIQGFVSGALDTSKFKKHMVDIDYSN